MAEMCDKSRFGCNYLLCLLAQIFRLCSSLIHLSTFVPVPPSLSLSHSLAIHPFRSHNFRSFGVRYLFNLSIFQSLARSHSIVRFTFTANINRRNYLNAWYILAPFWQSENINCRKMYGSTLHTHTKNRHGIHRRLGLDFIDLAGLIYVWRRNQFHQSTQLIVRVLVTERERASRPKTSRKWTWAQKSKYYLHHAWMTAFLLVFYLYILILSIVYVLYIIHYDN